MDRSAKKEIKEIRADFEKRIDGIMTLLKEKGPDTVAKAEESLKELREDLQDRLGDTQGSIDETVETSKREIREHPLLAVGVAVGVGIIIGMLLER